jgi:transposase InsO family protein
LSKTSSSSRAWAWKSTVATACADMDMGEPPPVCTEPTTHGGLGALATPLGSSRTLRDRDGMYGRAFDTRVQHLGTEHIKIAQRCPWQNGCAERWLGALRREWLDPVTNSFAVPGCLLESLKR